MRRAPSPAQWSGRDDAADGGRARRWHQCVRPADATGAPIVLLGFACDAGVARNAGRAGAAAGPEALRRALANVAAHAVSAVGDLGDVVCEDDALEAAQAEYAAVVAKAIGAGSLPIGLGGGHEIAYGSYCGLRDALRGTGGSGPIGIVNFDAHFDLRSGSRATSGTPFRQILENAAAAGQRVEYHCLGVSRYANTAALFDRARELDVRWVPDEEMLAERLPELARELLRLEARVDHLYLTVCLDALPAAVAPGVSAPAARGVELAVIEPLIDLLAASRKLRVADVAELNPVHDIDSRTARVAARLVARIAERHLARAD